MPVAGTQTSESEKPSVADRIVDAVQHAAHVSHEARLVKSLAYDAIEDGAHEAKRAVKKSVQRGIERLEDIKDAGCPLREASASEGHRDGRWRRSNGRHGRRLDYRPVQTTTNRQVLMVASSDSAKIFQAAP